MKPAFVYYWAYYHYCKWPNIEQIIYSSDHTDTGHWGVKVVVQMTEDQDFNWAIAILSHIILL